MPHSAFEAVLAGNVGQDEGALLPAARGSIVARRGSFMVRSLDLVCRTLRLTSPPLGNAVDGELVDTEQAPGPWAAGGTGKSSAHVLTVP
jgi:hypothetical protein